MDKFMHASGSELLMEAIPESLKNMLLVMETAGVFDPPSDGTVQDVSWFDAYILRPLLTINYEKSAMVKLR